MSTPHTLEAGQRSYAAFKEQVAAQGRNPDLVTVTPSVYTVVAETQAAVE